MELSYGDYNVCLVQNATDCILRFEDKKTLKLFENTFFERDFQEFQPFGGLEFVCNLIQWALEESNEYICVQDCSIVAKNLILNIKCYSPLFPKPFVVRLQLLPKRRESATEDMETMSKRLKEMEKTIRLLQGMKERMDVLEEMNGGMVMIPGCYPIPSDVQHLKLLFFGSTVPTGIPNLGNVLAGGNVSHQASAWNHPFYTHIKNTTSLSNANYTHVTNDSLTTIQNLKYLQSCETLVLSGMKMISDYSPIGQMKNLKTLAILGCPTHALDSQPYIPQLTDISWIKNLTKLENIYFTHCQQLTNVQPLKFLDNLTILNIQGTGVKNTDCLSQTALTITK